ncbi:MAG: twin-arginine translocation signal domain-containing protein [Bacteroidales bacterium]|nr:twin-arginine translocation signal domain-containing protein [Bacteroidales bacterium]
MRRRDFITRVTIAAGSLGLGIGCSKRAYTHSEGLLLNREHGWDKNITMKQKTQELYKLLVHWRKSLHANLPGSPPWRGRGWVFLQTPLPGGEFLKRESLSA